MNLLRASGERQQSDVARLLDGPRQTALVRRAHAGQASRSDLAAFRHELRQQTHIFVIDRFDLLDAELANFFAPEKLAAAFARTTGASAGTRTARTAAIAATALRTAVAALLTADGAFVSSAIVLLLSKNSFREGKSLVRATAISRLRPDQLLTSRPCSN